MTRECHHYHYIYTIYSNENDHYSYLWMTRYELHLFACQENIRVECEEPYLQSLPHLTSLQEQTRGFLCDTSALVKDLVPFIQVSGHLKKYIIK